MIDLPLTGIRVVDCAEGAMAATARLLGELGADVIRVEPPTSQPAPDDLAYAAANLGKRLARLAIESDAFATLVADADLVIETARPDSDDAARFAALAARNPGLVLLSISDFGRTGPWRDWRATDAVLHALTGGLSRSGIPGRAPLIPPGDLAVQTAAVQAAYVALVALIRRLRTGQGDHVDMAMIEAGMHALDPGFGIAGSAQSGVPLWKMARGRVEERHRYPVIACKDGHVRLCIMAPRQWRGMFAWMGSPAEFADPSFERLATRFRSPTLIPAIARMFAAKTRAEIEAEAVVHGVPAAALLDLDEAVATDQMGARRAFADVALPSGQSARFPNGTIEIDGFRAGVRGGVPIAADDPQFDAARPVWTPWESNDRPLTGLRVLDLGVIVVGAETGRLLADQGADVVKVENAAFPDGQRQSRDDAAMTITFAAGHRNKRGLSIDLKSEAGRALFLRLVAQADIMLSNFKPGTLDALGLDNATLAKANPRLVTVDSSAFGPSGPWSRRLGYGPLVRCSAGLTKRWVYPGEPDSFSDAITVYPDHVAARVGAIGALALVIRRLRTGLGGSASIAQAEVMIGHMAAAIAARSLGLPDEADRERLFACAGEDEWVVIDPQSDAQRAALDRITGDDVAGWAAGQTATAAMDLLQAAGVPAGAMLRVVELPGQPQFQALGTFRGARHPRIDGEVHVEAAVARSALPPPEQRPAPIVGEHSAEILREWLGLAEAEIAGLIDDATVAQAG